MRQLNAPVSPSVHRTSEEIQFLHYFFCALHSQMTHSLLASLTCPILPALLFLQSSPSRCCSFSQKLLNHVSHWSPIWPPLARSSITMEHQGAIIPDPGLCFTPFVGTPSGSTFSLPFPLGRGEPADLFLSEGLSRESQRTLFY